MSDLLRQSNHLSGPPTIFRFGAVGWISRPKFFRYERGFFIYDGPGKDFADVEITLSDNQWGQLWKLCDEIDIWSWPESVGDMRIYDGVKYNVHLEIGGRRAASMGQLAKVEKAFGSRVVRLHEFLQTLAGHEQRGF
jgi:hypothetical protein